MLNRFFGLSSAFSALLFCFSFSAVVQAKTVTLILGGGGDPPGESTMFDYSTQKIARFAKENYGDVRIAYDGSHPGAKRALKETLGSEPQSFTANTYKKELQRLLQEVRSKKIGKGDRLLIVVNSHGEKKSPNENTHGISIETNAASESSKISLDDLIPVQKELEKAGVKIGVVDLSCYSGNTQKLKSANTCVISSTAPDALGFDTFSNEFADQIQKNMSLESLYLLVRQRHSTVTERSGSALPMISTRAGEMAYRSLATLSSSVDYEKQLVDRINSSIGGVCEVSGVTAQITKLQADLARRGDLHDPKNVQAIAQLQEAVAEYQRGRESVEMLMKDIMRMHEEEEVGELSYSWIELARLNYKKGFKPTGANAEKLAKEWPMVQKDPKFEIATKKIIEYEMEMALMEKRATQVALAERKVYNLLYYDYKDKDKKTGREPCAEFVL